jgi:hypothetical protein
VGLVRPENRALLARRFPRAPGWFERAGEPAIEPLAGPAPALCVDGVQLESAFDPRAEAELQQRLVPAAARVATVHGFAQGTLVRVLLARASLERLDVVLLAARAARASLARVDHSDWLCDERVRLVLAAEVGALATPFVALPAELALADGEALRLCDLARLELATPFIRAHIDARERAWHARWAANRARIAGDGDVALLFGSRPGAAIAVAAAGPTLLAHAGRLRARPPDALLIAVDAALRPLAHAHVVPDLVVALDADRAALLLFVAELGAQHACSTLVYAPQVASEALARWRGPRLAFFPAGTRYDAWARELPRGRLWSSGSVLHVAVDLAVRMGASRVDLFGADFAHVGGRTHAAGFPWATRASSGGAWVQNARGERVASLPNLIGYLRDLERYVGQHRTVRFVSWSAEGARIAGTELAPEAARAA